MCRICKTPRRPKTLWQVIFSKDGPKQYLLFHMHFPHDLDIPPLEKWGPCHIPFSLGRLLACNVSKRVTPPLPVCWTTHTWNPELSRRSRLA